MWATGKLVLKVYPRFKMVATIGTDNYGYQCQSRWRISNTFYTLLREPYLRNVIKERKQIGTKHERIEEEDICDVNWIPQSKIREMYRTMGSSCKSPWNSYFLVKWKGSLVDQSICKLETFWKHDSYPIDQFYVNNLELRTFITRGQVTRAGGAHVSDIRITNSYTHELYKNICQHNDILSDKDGTIPIFKEYLLQSILLISIHLQTIFKR
jgi:hypothetical protein